MGDLNSAANAPKWSVVHDITHGTMVQSSPKLQFLRITALCAVLRAQVHALHWLLVPFGGEKWSRMSQSPLAAVSSMTWQRKNIYL
eukprot:SAG22_NODE_4568_length_1231_cov_1.681979_1_plen_86_part_00